MFGVSILKPDLNRKPSYDSATPEIGRHFQFACTCGTSIELDLPSYMRDSDLFISPQEQYVAIDTEYELNDRGEVVETVAKISLARNIRFALALNRKSHNIGEPFDASVKWWSCLKDAIKIRDRLTHPKWPSDLDVSPDEILKVVEAMRGFEEELMQFN